jgi:hypothetical protein
MSHKHVLFIGYDLEDENIKNIMRQVSDSLGENQKKMYLVAPDFKAHKVTYLANLGIEYFNFKGEAFVEKLYANIKECITDDFSKGYLSADTLRKFFENNSLNVELKAFNNKFNITSVNGLGDVQPKLSIKFKNEKPESFQSILDGRKFGGLQIDGSQLEQLKVHLNQINIVGNNIDDYRIRIESKAKREGKVNAVFEDSSEYEDIDYKLFTSDKILEIKVSYKNVEYTSQVKTDELEASNQAVTGSLTYNQVKPFANVNDAIKVTELGLHIAKEHGVILYFDGQSKGIPFILGPVKLPIEVIESNLAFFQSLKIVEKYYKVRFTNFDDFSEEVFDNVYKASAFAEKREHIQYWDEELTFDTQNGTPLELLLKVDEGAQLVVGSTEREELDIYDQRILLGYQVMEPLDLFIANLDNLKTGATTKAILKSKTKKIRIHFEETLPIQNETDHSL